ncbi:VWA domain-containing protein [Oscillatoriales cyanobacterium LEGE 11467]|uniref:VWA domain-containing protein n=1 Tax=Zarconia navalis LEGE 11467 TaxID=1828826 RepID=A0A928ZA17_9CYAN|nr:vWA domain-containing protein [Zarconia navalis]MBE9042354.1 VWA domain-containing protein [Zarconia navalis LEGE 11467]
MLTVHSFQRLRAGQLFLPRCTSRHLENTILPRISVQTELIPDEIALNYSTENIAEPLPDVEKYPLYGAQPSTDPNAVYIEIFSSAEKANGKKIDERWLVDVAEAFNQQQFTTSSQQVIQVGIRKIPSGVGERTIAGGAAQPAMVRSHGLWLEMLKSKGIGVNLVTDSLLPNNAGFVIQNQLKKELWGNEDVTFDRVLDAILAGKITVGYTNPFTSSTGMNLLHTLLWQAAGHHQDGSPLTSTDLQSPQVRSVFETHQKQVLITALITPDLKNIAIRDPQKLPAFAVSYLDYSSLKQLPEFAQTSYIPFGIPHSNPLAGFSWNTAQQQEALQKFAEFANTQAMQKLAPDMGDEVINYIQRPDLPKLPAGDVLIEAQSFWKKQKDGDRTVYLMGVIDTSGSMEGEPLNAVKSGLQIASKEINSGNYFGLITFDDRPHFRLPLAPFDTLQHQRLLAAIDYLRADGSTAMYDAIMVGLSELMKYQKDDPNGRFYLLVLTDGDTNRGFNFARVKSIIQESGVRVYPIAYGDVNQSELDEIAALRESTVKLGTPENVQGLLKGLFQTNL